MYLKKKIKKRKETRIDSKTQNADCALINAVSRFPSLHFSGKRLRLEIYISARTKNKQGEKNGGTDRGERRKTREPVEKGE